MMKVIFSLRKYRVTTIGYNIFKIYIIKAEGGTVISKDHPNCLK